MTDSDHNDQYEKIDHADRWLRAALDIVSPPGFLQAINVDMSACKALIDNTSTDNDVKITYTHAFVKAAALALADDPQLHQLVIGNTRCIPGCVSIGLSVDHDSFVAPVLVIEDAANKSLANIAREMVDGVPQARKEHDDFLNGIRRWGGLVPFAFLRRFILRRIVSRHEFVRQANGSFQVSCLRDADLFAPFLFSTTAIMGTGQVADRAGIENGNMVVQPQVTLTCCADHRVWNGANGTRFLNRVKTILESGAL